MSRDFDAVYWAGIFDMNGSISIERRKSIRNRAFVYVVSVRVVLPASPRAGQLMDELWPRFGGGVTWGRGLLLNWELRYRVTGIGAIALVQELAPHLRAKALQAAEVLAYTRRMDELVVLTEPGSTQEKRYQIRR